MTMKRVRDVSFFKGIRQIHEFPFATFYFFDDLVISEIKEGVVYDWEMSRKGIAAAKEFFGNNMPIAYISNRVNNYQVNAADWAKFFKNRHQLWVYCIVGYNHRNFASIILEKVFFKNPIKKFNDLEEAINWTLDQLKVLKKDPNLLGNME